MNEEQENEFLELTEVECRILGCLIEKEITTPDYYPLSLNSLTNACNQKSNRNPVVAYDEPIVEAGSRSLQSKRMVMVFHKGGKVTKYEQHVRNVLPQLERPEYAILGELLLRGPQTLGELKGHASRMHSFTSLEVVDSVLQWLMEHNPPLAVKLPRQAGRKEQRYYHKFSPEPLEFATALPSPSDGVPDRIGKLEAETVALREEVESLKQAFAEFKAQFE